MKSMLGQPDASVGWVRAPEVAAARATDGSDSRPDDPTGRETRLDALVVDASRSEASDDIVESVHRALADRTTRPGTICVAYDHHGIRGGVRDTIRRIVGRESSAARIARALERAGYVPIHTCVSPGRASGARAFYSVGSDLYTLPPHSHPIRRAAELVGLEHLKYSSTSIFAARTESAGFPVLSAISRWLPGAEDTAPRGRQRLLGFRMRTRGTLLVFTESESTSERFVTKLSLRADVDGPLRNSFRLQEWVRSTADARVRSVIPKPLRLVERARVTVGPACLETMERGVVAWKVNVGSKRTRIERDALDFLESLQDQTRRPMECTEDLLGELLDSTVGRARSSAPAGPVLAEELACLARRIRADHVGERIGLVASHGDFGIGNVLVERDSGAMTAVVDWADGRRVEFPSVDPFNWSIQQKRDREDESFVGAVKALRAELSRGSSPLDPCFLAPGSSRRERYLAGLRTAVFRYVGRSLRYRGSFESECGRPEAVAELLDDLTADG